MIALAERLERWSLPEPTSGCVLWLRGGNAKGYGTLRIGARTWLAHRAAWNVAHGDPGEMCVLHRCDTPACINVDHLFLGTSADNTADMIAKGRDRKVSGEGHPRRRQPELWPSGDAHWARQQPDRVLRGERNGRAKLTVAAAADIRQAHSAGESLRSIARRCSVHRTTVRDIVRGVTWR